MEVDDSTSNILATLKLDEKPLVNQFMFVEELNMADTSFIESYIIKEQIKRNQTVILVLCHSSFGHFFSISRKLGYNLLDLRDEEKVIVVDVLAKIVNENFCTTKGAIKNFYLSIKEQIDGWDSSKGACVIIENLGNLLLGDKKEAFELVGNLRALLIGRPNSSFMCSFHNFKGCPDFNNFAKSVRHFADVTVMLDNIQTGGANDITGHLTVIRRNEKYSKEVSEYQYQVQTKGVTTFTPGLRYIRA